MRLHDDFSFSVVNEYSTGQFKLDGPLVCLALIGKLDGLVSLPQPIDKLSTEFNSFLSVHDSGDSSRHPDFAHSHVAGWADTDDSPSDIFRVQQTNNDQTTIAGCQMREISTPFFLEIKTRDLDDVDFDNAGVTEELYFRLLAPVLIFAVTGSAFWAILASTLWFGLAHYYQGWIGIAATTCIGALFAAVYLYVGHLASHAHPCDD